MDTEHSERVSLMDRAAQLFQEFGGPRWSEISATLEKEGFLEDGKALSSNALRKRFYKNPTLKKLLEDYRQGKPGKREATRTFTVPKEHVDKRAGAPATRVKRDNTPNHTSDETVTARELLELLQGSMQRRDEMLLAQIRRSNTMSDTKIIQQIQEELQLMETRISDFEDRLTILVEDKVEEILKTMIVPGGSFAKDLETLMTRILDKRMSGEVGTLLSALPMTGQGPGKQEGEGGKMARFSATMPQHIYDAMKSIEDDSSFSSRIAAACNLYVRTLASQNGKTEYEKEG